MKTARRSADYVAPRQTGYVAASAIVERKPRDCSKLTIEQLIFLAATPGNADCAAELEARQAR